MKIYEADISLIFRDGRVDEFTKLIATPGDVSDLTNLARQAVASQQEKTASQIANVQYAFREVDIRDNTKVMIVDDDVDADVGAVRLVDASILAALSDLMREIGDMSIAQEALDELVCEIYGDEAAEQSNQHADAAGQELAISSGEVKAAYINCLGVEVQVLTILEGFGPVEGRQRLLDALTLTREPAL